MSHFRPCDRDTPYLLPPSLAFRYIAANTHPDHDTLCAFRKRFLKEIEALFVQVLCIAKEMNRDYMDVMPLGGTG
jgi:transposase